MAKRELSSTLKNLKFMQRGTQRVEKIKKVEEEVIPDRKFPSSSTPKKWPICRTISDSVYVLDTIVGFDCNDANTTREASKYIPTIEPNMTVGKLSVINDEIILAAKLQRSHTMTTRSTKWPLTGGISSQLSSAEDNRIKRIYILEAIKMDLSEYGMPHFQFFHLYLF